MTKQEQGFSNEFRLTRLAAKIIKANLDKPFIVIGNLIVRDFHSQGCVLKVDRELPDKPLADDWAEAIRAPRNAFYELAQKDMLKAGYVAVEPLLKKEVSSG